MSQSVGVIWNDALSAYSFGPTHPFNSVRVSLAMRLSDEFGLFDHANVEMHGDFANATDEDLLRVHTPELLAAVRSAALDPAVYHNEALGLGTTDTPAFKDMHNASARVAGATLAAAKEVHTGRAQHAINMSGGLHHAMPDRASGFCVYNDIAVAISWLLEQGVERIGYVDVDVHHGDGVEAVYWDDPRVLTISIHESPVTLFPGTGYPTEIGGPRAQGSAVNIALPAGTGDQGWLRALQAVAQPLLAKFRPQVLVSQHGCDSHFEDPLANLTVSIDGQRVAAEAIHRWSHRYSDGKWIAVGGGGYEWVDVVPRAWTHLMGILIGKPIFPQTQVPLGYQEYVLELLHRPAPRTMTDGFDPWPRSWDQGFNPDDPLDAAVLATRAAVFPHHGIALDEW